jgi:uncharacterized membrane protein
MRSKTQASERRRRKLITFIWIALLSLVVISLIYWEQTALLYILATLGVTALLVVVALSDLGGETITGERAETSDGTVSDSNLRSTFGSVP